jgi:hypothetical protein
MRHRLVIPVNRRVVRSALWFGFLIALAMSSGIAIGQTAAASDPAVAADPWASLLSAIAQSPTAAAMVYGFRVFDNWRTTVTSMWSDLRDDMRDGRLSITVRHRHEGEASPR